MAAGDILEPALPADHHTGQVGKWRPTDVANNVAIVMECQGHYEGSQRLAAGYPASVLMEMKRGYSLHPPYVARLETEEK